MKVLILHQYFRTPEEGGGIRSYYLAKALLTAGHSVEVLTAWNRPDKRKLVCDGIPVQYLPVFYDNTLGFNRRIRSFLLFYLSAYRYLSQNRGFDIIYAISTPLSVGLLALTLHWRKKIPYIFEVGDLWPDVPVQMGILKSPLLIWLIKKMEIKIYQAANDLVAMSPPIHSYLANLGFAGKTTTITNFADMVMAENNSENGKNLAIKPTSFRLAYAGAIGRANRLRFLLDLAAEATLRNITHFECLIMGEGAEREELMKEASARNLQNVSFFSHGSKMEAFTLLNSSDMVYLSFDNFSMLWTGSPNKYFDALATGKPVLCNFGGWIREEILSADCGFCYDPAHPELFFERIWPAIQDPLELSRRGENARALARTKYSLEIQLSEWLALFEIKPVDISTG